jgi:t-SNARE complex subunit (syntaxin)
MESQQKSFNSKMTSKLADAIYTDLGKVKRLKRSLKMYYLFEDQEMLSIVSVIVSHKLLAILKPSVSNPYDSETSDLEDSCSNDLEDAESEGVHYATGRKVRQAQVTLEWSLVVLFDIGTSKYSCIIIGICKGSEIEVELCILEF